MAWTKTDIERTKARLTTELGSDKDVAAQVQFLLEKIADLGPSGRQADQLTVVIGTISMFLRDQRAGVLSDRQIRDTARLAQDQLILRRLRGKSLAVDRLERDLLVSMSQLYRTRSRPWLACWFQTSAAGAGSGVTRDPKVLASGLLGEANRMLRLGFADLALKVLEQVDFGAIDAATAGRLLLLKMQALRLAARFGDAAAAAGALEALALDDKALQGEVAWEAWCRQAAQSQDVAPIVRSVRSGGSHRQGVYVVEAYFWAQALPTTRWSAKVTKPTSLAQNQALRVRRLGKFYQLATALEESYDASIAVSARRRVAGSALESLDGLLTIDKELLVLAAFARWLHRTHAPELAEVVRARYGAICMSLSAGRSNDVLGLAADI